MLSSSRFNVSIWCVILCGIRVIFGQAVMPRDCRNVPANDEFDVGLFTGRWYVQAQSGRPEESCVILDIAKNNFYIELIRHSHFKKTGKTLRMNGLGDPTDLPAIWNDLNIHFHKICPTCLIWYIRSMRVVSVKHDEKAILYSCRRVEPSQYPHICRDVHCSEYNVWVLGRNQNSTSRDGDMNYAVQRLGLDLGGMYTVDHEGCEYARPPENNYASYDEADC